MQLLLPTCRPVDETELVDLYDTGPGPWLRAGFVSSVDGVIALGGVSGALSSTADKAVFRTLRTGADAVVVGAGTAREEDYGPVRHSAEAASWRAAHGRQETTPVVIVSQRGHLDPGAKVLQGPVVLVVPGSADVDPALEVDVVRAGDTEVDAHVAVAQLRARGYERLLCEGGPALLATLLEAAVVDELCLTTAGAIAGGPTLVPHPLSAGTTVELTQLLHEPPATLLARWQVVRSSRG